MTAAMQRDLSAIDVSIPPNAGNPRQLQQEQRLEKMGLKNKELVRKMNGGKMIDQMQWHTDLRTNEADKINSGEHDFKKIPQKARAQ